MAEEAANGRAGGPAADELAAVDRTQALLLLARKNFLVRAVPEQHAPAAAPSQLSLLPC